MILKIYKYIYIILSYILHKDYVLFISNYDKEFYGNLTCIFKVLFFDRKFFLKVHKCSLINELIHIYYIAKSKVIITDVVIRYIRFLPISPETKIIFCGHGGGLYKKMGYAAIEGRDDISVQHRRKVHEFYGKLSFIVSSFKNGQMTPCLINNYHIQATQILPFGLPRTDSLYELNCVDAKKRFIDNNSELAGKKIILYAPTFRKAGRKRILPVYLDDGVLRNELLFDYVIFFRGHPTVSVPDLPVNWVDTTDWPLYDCLALADILVTDYSSILFDFSFFQRPIYLLAPDAESYVKTQCSVWVEPQELVGDFFCRDTAELAHKINDPPRTLPGIWQSHMNACDGNASKRLADFIMSLMNRE